jgi:hypothetical protein
MKMPMRPLRLFVVASSAFALALAGACSLNPQPIPPGFDNDDAGFNASDDAARGGTGANDGDGAAPVPINGADAASDGGAQLLGDGGDAGDAGDAANDAPDGD